jgi:hypothetical protein
VTPDTAGASSPAAYNEWHIDGAVLWNICQDLKDPGYRPAGTTPASHNEAARTASASRPGRRDPRSSLALTAARISPTRSTALIATGATPN